MVGAAGAEGVSQRIAHHPSPFGVVRDLDDQRGLRPDARVELAIIRAFSQFTPCPSTIISF